MYARSYEKNDYEEAPALPSGYRGTAFEHELGEPCAPAPDESISASAPYTERESTGALSFLERLIPIKRMLPEGRSGLFGSLFSDAEDILLLGIFLLLLFSKEGDTLCAIAVLFLLISDKI